MIFKEIATGNQMECNRWSCTTPSEVIALPTSEESKDFCMCDYSTAPCTYYEYAFTDVDDTSNEYTNDYRKFLLNPLSETSAFSFVIIDSDSAETVVYSFDGADYYIDELYGTISEQGYNESQPLQVGVNINWAMVSYQLGNGDYTIKTSQTDFSTETSNTSHAFRVVPFNVKRANSTIKIEVNNVGVTMNGSNWTGILEDGNSMFTNMVRVYGRLLLTDPEIEIESITNGSRELKPIQTKITDTYSIAIDRIPFDIGYSLVHESISMNWSVTDYNVFNEDLRDKELIVQSSSVTNVPDFAMKSYELTGVSNISKLNRKFI